MSPTPFLGNPVLVGGSAQGFMQDKNSASQAFIWTLGC